MEFRGDIVLQYYPLLLEGLWMTILMSLLSLAIGIVIGFLACLGKLSGEGVGFRTAALFIDFFRTIPEMVLIFWVYSCLPLLLEFRLDSFGSGLIALSLFSAAYLAEILRAGILAVPRGQIEAARALGIPNPYVWGRVILPPAVRAMSPAFVSFLTELLKVTSLLSTIGVAELVYQASSIGARTFHYFELFTAIALMYFALIFPLSLYVRRADHKRALKTGT